MKKKVFLSAAVLLAGTLTVMSCSAEELTLSLPLPVGDRAQVEAPDNYEEVTQDEFDSMDRAMRAFVPAGDSLLKNKAEDFYYYSQLNEEQQALYDCMMVLTDYPDEEDNLSLYLATMDPSSDEFMEEVFTVYLAMTYDHPELFWLYNSSKTSIGWGAVPGDSDITLVFFYLTEPYTDYREDMTAFNDAAEAFLADIDTSGSEENTVRQIHDKLVDMVVYDDDVLNDMVNSGSDLAHTAFGALVKNSSGIDNYAVCDGYSLAFEYLLQQVGIECTYVGGFAGSTEDDMGGHAWNIVKIDGQWYEVDTTWDDVGNRDDSVAKLDKDSLEYKCFSEALQNAEYRDHLEHYLYGRTTSDIRHFVPDESDYYVTEDQLYIFTLLEESVHVRDAEDMPGSIMGIVSSLAPEASASLH